MMKREPGFIIQNTKLSFIIKLCWRSIIHHSHPWTDIHQKVCTFKQCFNHRGPSSVRVWAFFPVEKQTNNPYRVYFSVATEELHVKNQCFLDADRQTEHHEGWQVELQLRLVRLVLRCSAFFIGSYSFSHF